MRVSVCAVQSEMDVRAVVSGGADAVGVLVQVAHVAEDAVTLEHAANLLGLVPPYVGRYAVTHAKSLPELLAAAALPIDSLQIHDDVDPSLVTALRQKRPQLRILKALHVTEREAAPDIGLWDGIADAVVLDSVDLARDRIGGTGHTHDWEISASLVRQSSVPTVLAGGLRPDNVSEAVARVRPWAVNVNSGVETDGAKDMRKVRAFAAAANGLSA